MTFLNGFKQFFYLMYIIPIYDAILAAWLLNLWARSKEGKWAASMIALLFAGLQLSISIQHIRADEYHRDYEPTVRELELDRAEGKRIAGTAALGFGMEFSGFKDDARLGMYSGLVSRMCWWWTAPTGHSCVNLHGPNRRSSAILLRHWLPDTDSRRSMGRFGFSSASSLERTVKYRRGWICGKLRPSRKADAPMISSG